MVRLKLSIWGAVLSMVLLMASVTVVIASTPSVIPGVDVATGMGKAAAEVAEKIPNDITRLALQVAIYLIFALIFFMSIVARMMFKVIEKGTFLDNEKQVGLAENWFARAFTRGYDKAMSDMAKRQEVSR